MLKHTNSLGAVVSRGLFHGGAARGASVNHHGAMEERAGSRAALLARCRRSSFGGSVRADRRLLRWYAMRRVRGAIVPLGSNCAQVACDRSSGRGASRVIFRRSEHASKVALREPRFAGRFV